MKNVLSDSLSFATVLMVGNWSGAIAQTAVRYPTDAEMSQLNQEYEQVILPLMKKSREFGRNAQGERSPSLNSFANDWAKINPNLSPFLGGWQKQVASLMIYPSKTSKNACVVMTLPAREGSRFSGNSLDAQFAIASFSDGQLRIKTSGWFYGFLGSGAIFIRRGNVLSIATIEQNKPKISPYSAYSDPLRDIESLPLANTAQNRRVQKQFYDAGCTASLPSNNQTQISTQEHPAKAVVSDFYTWYLNNSRHREVLYQKKESFTPNLYRYLERAIRITQANNQWSGMLNYDLFSFTQVGSYSFEITSVVPKENYTEVYLNLEVGLRRSRNLQPIKVIVVRNGNSWQIDNFYFLRDSSKNSNLLSELIKFNQVQRFQNVPWGNYETIPSVPSSSIPVKPTDSIAKYPTNDDFEKVDRILQASRNPESLVNLKGNQQNQRRKFQKEWESRNPAAAKFLGGWYTGNKSFYVYPSTVKGGTCVVTKDYQGNLTMQIGTVLNRELRYGGGKGFFWINRENIVASRDSGNGDLYPIYATYEVPELPASMISDMESQKCITTLPSDPVAASLPSPLYEDVTDPAFKLSNLYRINGMTKTFRVGLNAFDIVDNGQTVKLNSTNVKPNVPTIIITHGWKNDPSSSEFREFQNFIKAVKNNSSMQVLVVDWGQGAKTGANLDIAAARIEASASKVADLVKKYKLKPSDISLIGHSLGAHLSVDLALELQKRNLGGVKSITLLDPAVDLAGGYQVKDLSKVNKSTFIRAFYTSALGSSSFAASANESYNIKYPVGVRLSDYSHGEALTLLANSFQGNSSGKRNCIAEQFIKLDQQFPNIPQNTSRERPAYGTKPATDLYVDYDSNKWLYPKQIVSGALDVNPEKGNCKLESDAVRTFDSIQNILK